MWRLPLIVIVICLIGFWILKSKQETTPISQSEEVIASQTAAATSAKRKDTTQMAKPTKLLAKTVDTKRAPDQDSEADDLATQLKVVDIPTVQGYRREIEQNPHGGSSLQLTFAHQLHQLRLAVHTADDATHFMKWLGDCADSSSATAITAQVLCLRVGDDIAKKYTNTSSQYQEIRRRAPDEVRRRVDVISKY